MPNRRMLLVYPRFGNNHFLNFEYMTPFYPGKRAVMPSLGLLTFASVAAGQWEIRLADENVAPLDPQDLRWADVVALSGMHPQRRRIEALLEMANALGKITILGGPSVSICPEYYPTADVLHVGEIGDATENLLEYLQVTQTKPKRQIVFRTLEKTPLESLPVPAYERIEVNRYLVMPTQFSVGCPYTCEFCDIPILYGRAPRVKSAARVRRDLDAIFATSFVGTILFVDDNLIAHRKSLMTLLPEVSEWQRARGFPYPLTAEASVNVARDRAVLRAMHEARFTHLFLGVESPEEATLVDISKRQNTLEPVLDSIRHIQAAGIEVIMGMILGFDTDTPNTGTNMQAFIEASQAPIVYFNLLAALPKTPLWERLSKENRLLADSQGDARRSGDLLNCLTSNVRYRLPKEMVENMLRETVRAVYSPASVYRRFLWNAEHVYGKQIQGVPPAETRAQQKFLLLFTVKTLARVLWRIGCRSDYRERFWKFCGSLIRLRLQGRIASILEVLLRVTPNAHHLIQWGRNLDAQQAVAELTHRQTPDQMVQVATRS